MKVFIVLTILAVAAVNAADEKQPESVKTKRGLAFGYGHGPVYAAAPAYAAHAYAAPAYAAPAYAASTYVAHSPAVAVAPVARVASYSITHGSPTVLAHGPAVVAHAPAVTYAHAPVTYAHAPVAYAHAPLAYTHHFK